MFAGVMSLLLFGITLYHQIAQFCQSSRRLATIYRECVAYVRVCPCGKHAAQKHSVVKTMIAAILRENGYSAMYFLLDDDIRRIHRI